MKIVIFILFTCIFLQANQAHDENINALMCAYPKSIMSIKDNKIYFKDKTFLPYEDKNKTDFTLNNVDIKNTLSLDYPLLQSLHVSKIDAGRYRNEAFLHKLYGENEQQIKQNLVQVKWLPSHTNIQLWFNKKQNAAKSLLEVSNELDKLPQKYIKYINNPSGTFVYRKIKNTNRLSAHSFAIAIDINTKYANYWLWDKKSKYKNQIPKTIVHIFEKHGFIWGGRWAHYDSMHFEYRPEFTCKANFAKIKHFTKGNE